MKQAEWNDITWGSSEKQAAFIKSFHLSQGVKTEENKDSIEDAINSCPVGAISKEVEE